MITDKQEGNSLRESIETMIQDNNLQGLLYHAGANRRQLGFPADDN
jgi:hypothetical protein